MIIGKKGVEGAQGERRRKTGKQYKVEEEGERVMKDKRVAF